MAAIFGWVWFVIGIIWSMIGKDFLEVCACFIIFGIFLGVEELADLRAELEDLDDEE